MVWLLRAKKAAVEVERLRALQAERDTLAADVTTLKLLVSLFQLSRGSAKLPESCVTSKFKLSGLHVLCLPVMNQLLFSASPPTATCSAGQEIEGRKEQSRNGSPGSLKQPAPLPCVVACFLVCSTKS